MKILIISNFLPPKIGGIERHSHEFASELARNAFNDVTVLCSSWPTGVHNSTSRDHEKNYKTIFMPSIIIFRRLPAPNIFSPRFWFIFFGLRQDYDLVFFQSHLFVLNWLLAIYMRGTKRRIWMNHGCNFVPVRNSLLSFLLKIYELLGMVIMRYFCNEFLAQSRNAANWITNETKCKFDVLPNAINLQLFSNLKVYSESKAEIRALFVGRFVIGKGLLECIRVIAEANTQLSASYSAPKIKLIIIGSGPVESDAQDLILKLNLDAQFLGELEHTKVIEEMCKSQFLIQYYDRPEGMPTVSLEALACGMVVFTTPVGGPEDLEGCTNFRVGSIDKLPALMVEEALELRPRGELVLVGRSFIESGWSWESVAKKITMLN